MGENLRIPDEEIKGTMDRRVDVYIWDMDETLILLKSLLNGTYAEAFNGSKDVQKGVEIGKMWEKHILDLCDGCFFYEQIENYNKPFLGALSEYDDGKDLSDYDFGQDGLGLPSDDDNKRKLAYMHRVIAQKYEKGLHNLFDQETMKLWNELYDITDKYTEGWLSSARAFLEQCSSGKTDTTSTASADGMVDSADSTYQHVNVLVTSGSLIPSLVKCLLFRLDNLITHENGEQIVSTRDGGVHRFLDQWQGQPNSDCTWITRDELQQLDPDLLEYYQSSSDFHLTGSSSSHPGGVSTDTRYKSPIIRMFGRKSKKEDGPTYGLMDGTC